MIVTGHGQNRGDCAPFLVLRRLHVFGELLRQFGVQLRTAGLGGQHPRYGAHRFGDDLHLLVVDF